MLTEPGAWGAGWKVGTLMQCSGSPWRVLKGKNHLANFGKSP